MFNLSAQEQFGYRRIMTEIYCCYGEKPQNRPIIANLSPLSAQVIICLLRENQKTIPKCLSVNLFKNVSLHILNFIPVSLLIKNSPNGIMLSFLCFLTFFNAVKTDTDLTLHHMGIFLII